MHLQDLQIPVRSLSFNRTGACITTDTSSCFSFSCRLFTTAFFSCGNYNAQWKGGVALVLYLDLVFLLNFLSDLLALYITGRLSSLSLRSGRMIGAALLGGGYGVICCLPIFSLFCNFITQLFVAVIMTRIVFGKQETFLRLLFLFLVLSCTLGGAVIMVSQGFAQYGINETLKILDWKVFILVGVICYFVLTVIFHGSAKHAVAGQLCRIGIKLGEQKIVLDALHDTGHTLCDPCNGNPVITIWHRSVENLWSKDEQEILGCLETQDSVQCAQRLGELSPGRFRLIPYRAVGVDCAMLLAFVADEVWIDHCNYGKMTIVLSPTPVSDGGGYTALWGGERMEKTENVGVDQEGFISDTTACGADFTG